MSYGDNSEVGPAAEGHEVATLGLHVELLAAVKQHFHRKRLAPFVQTELDTGNRFQRHLAVKVFFAVEENGIGAASFNETGELGIADGQLHSIIQTHNDGEIRY